MSERKIAIVTGAGRGIGRATAIALAEAGYTCVAVSRSQAEIDETANLAGHDSIAIVADVCNPTQTDAVVQQTLDRFGRIDALVNNAGIAPLLAFDQMTDAIWDEVIATNLTSVYRFTKAVWPIMIRQKSGVIVNLSSESSRDPFPGLSAYAAAKAGVNLFTKALAKEADAHGIRVYAIAPAGVETAMLRKFASQEQLPPSHVLLPEDVARVVRTCVCGGMLYASGETIYLHRHA